MSSNIGEKTFPLALGSMRCRSPIERWANRGGSLNAILARYLWGAKDKDESERDSELVDTSHGHDHEHHRPNQRQGDTDERRFLYRIDPKKIGKVNENYPIDDSDDEMNRLELVELGPEWKVVVGDKRSIHTAIEKRQYKCTLTTFLLIGVTISS